MVAKVTNHAPTELVVAAVDAHIYLNQVEQIKEQMSRDSVEDSHAKVLLNPDVKDIDAFTFNDIKIVGYKSHPFIEMPVAV